MVCRGNSCTPPCSSYFLPQQTTYTGYCGDISCNQSVRDDALRECGSQCCIIDSQFYTNEVNKCSNNPTVEPSIETNKVGKYDDCRTTYNFKVPQGYTLYCETVNMAYQSDRNGCVNLALQKGFKYQFKLINDSTNYFVTERNSYKTKVFEVDVANIEEGTTSKKTTSQSNFTSQPRSNSTIPSLNNPNSENLGSKQDGNILLVQATQYRDKGYTECTLSIPKGYSLQLGDNVYKENGDGKVTLRLPSGVSYYTFNLLDSNGRVVTSQYNPNNPKPFYLTNEVLRKKLTVANESNENGANTITQNMSSRGVERASSVNRDGGTRVENNANTERRGIANPAGENSNSLNQPGTKGFNTNTSLNKEVQCRIKIPNGYQHVCCGIKLETVNNGYVTFNLPRKGNIHLELTNVNGYSQDIQLRDYNIELDENGMGVIDLTKLRPNGSNVIITSKKTSVSEDNDIIKYTRNGAVVRLPSTNNGPGQYAGYQAYIANEKSPNGDDRVICKIKVPKGYFIHYANTTYTNNIDNDGYFRFDCRKNRTYYFTLVDINGRVIKDENGPYAKVFMLDVNQLKLEGTN